MKWGIYQSWWDAESIDRLRAKQWGSWDRFYATQMTHYFARTSNQNAVDDAFTLEASKAAVMQAEQLWYQARRPYYKVWPGIENALLRTSLNLEEAQVPALPLPVVLVLFNDQRSSDVPFQSMLMFDGRYTSECDGLFLSVFMPDESFTNVLVTRDKIKEVVGGTAMNIAEPGATSQVTNHEAIVRLAVGLCLLANNPAMVEPDYLNDDASRVASAKAAGDQAALDRLAAKAEQRGKYGFTIGRHVEHCPHLRRPHFGIRHTGPGGMKPMLVPIKAAVVNRKKFTEVPTGYLDDELTGAGPAEVML